MSSTAAHDPATLAAELLACANEQRAAWIEAHRAALNLELVEALKQYSDQRLLSDPPAANRATLLAQQLAPLCSGELARGLASWARGNWEAYHDPHTAIQSYQQALALYRAAAEQLSVARLLGNLVFVYADCGLFAEAEIAYDEARAVYLPLGANAALYLLRLEQNYGILLRNQGLYDTALAVHERAYAMAIQLDRPDIAAEIQVNRTLTLGMLGRLAEGEAALLQSRAQVESHGQMLTVARIDMNLGELYAALGRPAEALRRLHASGDRFAELGNQMEVASVLLREAALFERIGAWHEARRSYAKARQSFDTLKMLPQVGIALVRQAAASRQYGEFQEAAQLLDTAERLWEQLDQPLWRATVCMERVALALAQRDAAGAVSLLETLPLPQNNPALMARHDLLFADIRALVGLLGSHAARAESHQAYQRVLSYARAQGDRWAERQALVGLARIEQSGDVGSARKRLVAAAELDDATRLALSVEELKASFQAQSGDVLALLTRLAMAGDRPLEALANAWRMKGSALLDLLRAAAQPAGQPGEQAEAERLRQKIAVVRWQLARDTASTPTRGPAQEHDPRSSVLEQQLSELRRRHNQAPASGAPPLDRPAPLLEQLGDELLIEYVRCGDDLLALRADSSGNCQGIWLAQASRILDILDMLQLSFQNVLTQPQQQRRRHLEAWMAESQSLLARCYQAVLAPLLGPADEGRRLLIAPCDPLYLLPFAALWDGQHYLAERFEIDMIASGALLAAPAVRAAGAGALVIGASAQGRLEAVARESAAVGAALPEASVLIDDPGDLARLSSLSAAPWALHIAAHSVLREDSPIFSALQLAGGLLSVEQCYDLPLAGAELVTLSGCTTATGQDTGGSLLAFQSAFLVAGARRVLSSLWPIDDTASAAWMGEFYRALASGLAPATALRATQRAMLYDPGFAHPAIWAAFICSRR
jgi:CHAT domain-containing protein